MKLSRKTTNGPLALLGHAPGVCVSVYVCVCARAVAPDDNADRRLLRDELEEGGGGGELPKIVLALCRQYPSSDSPAAGTVLDLSPRCVFKSLVSIWISLKYSVNDQSLGLCGLSSSSSSHSEVSDVLLFVSLCCYPGHLWCCSRYLVLGALKTILASR